MHQSICTESALTSDSWNAYTFSSRGPRESSLWARAASEAQVPQAGLGLPPPQPLAAPHCPPLSCGSGTGCPRLLRSSGRIPGPGLAILSLQLGHSLAPTHPAPHPAPQCTPGPLLGAVFWAPLWIESLGTYWEITVIFHLSPADRTSRVVRTVTQIVKVLAIVRTHRRDQKLSFL